MAGSICGAWIDAEGRAHVARAQPDGRRVEELADFRPFAWLRENPLDEAISEIEIEALKGDGAFAYLAHAGSLASFKGFTQVAREAGGVDILRPLEAQFLLQKRERLFADLTFAQLRRCQLDIETSSTDGAFSDARKPGDRVLAIGLRQAGRNRLLVLVEETDEAEKQLLADLNTAIAELDPDVIEGHNIFKFDWEFLRLRCRRHRVPCAWGRFGQTATFRNSRLKVAERWIDFPRCDLAGRAVVDTYLMVQLFDITTRELSSYGLKDVAVYFGITDEDSAERTYIEGSKIADCYRSDRPRFCAYLEDDLRETEGVANLLLPTYVEQVRAFPLTLQEACLRGTSTKVDLLFLEEYYHARQAVAEPREMASFEGGYTKSFEEGVFKHVLHFDVASLYPSLLMAIGRNPQSDSLGVFVPLLKKLRDYRLKFKMLARTAEDADLRAEYAARQSAFKILINSFYGYLGFSGARFGDGELAAEVTRRGRELLQALIDEFVRLGCVVLEADTDGIYLSSPDHFAAPDGLLKLMAGVLPEGIELEFDGSYQAMFCYKAKNYALYDGSKITLRGSALRSRGIEPYLKSLSEHLIKFLLGVVPESPEERLRDLRERIANQTVPVAQLAKSEILSQNPEVYARNMAAGGKPRRASAEVALKMTPQPKMGERVSFYILLKEKGQTSDWQRARPLADYHPSTAPYDPQYYLKKLDDWEKRYGTFLDLKPIGDVQGELL